MNRGAPGVSCSSIGEEETHGEHYKPDICDCSTSMQGIYVMYNTHYANKKH